MSTLADSGFAERVPALTRAMFEELLRGMTGAAAQQSAAAGQSAAAEALAEAAQAGYQRIELAAHLEWMVRQLQAEQCRMLAESADLMPDARRASPDPSSRSAHSARSTQVIEARRLVSARFAPQTNCHPATATMLVQDSIVLSRDLPLIMALFRQGHLDRERARTIAYTLHKATQTLDDLRPGSERWHLLERAIASQAPRLHLKALERLLERFLLQLQPQSGAEAHREALRSRHVRVQAQPNGMASIDGMVSADVAQLFDALLDEIADAMRDQANAVGKPDPRTHDQRRADALELIVRANASGQSPIHPKPTPPTPAPTAPSPAQTAPPTSAPTPSPATPSPAAPATPSPAAPSADSTAAPRHPAPHRPAPNPPGEAARPSNARAQNPPPSPTPADDACPAPDTSPAPNTNPTPGANQDEVHPALSAESEASPATDNLAALLKAVRRDVHLVVTITDATLLGLDTVPGLLSGYGPIPSELARKLAGRADRATLLVLPGSTAPSVGDLNQPGQFPRRLGPVPAQRTAKQPGARSNAPTSGASPCPLGVDHGLLSTRRSRPGRTLVRLVTTLFPTCVFPGCTVPASRCDLDHVIPFEHGGPTCLCNIRPSCRTHHRLKTFGDWSARTAPSGQPFDYAVKWTAPDGNHFASQSICLPGTPGWSLPLPPVPPASETLIPVDFLPAPERAQRRAKRWKDDLRWHEKNQQEQERAAAERRATARDTASRRPLPRTPQAPWGLPEGPQGGLEEPPF